MYYNIHCVYTVHTVQIVSSIGCPVDIYAEIILAAKRFSGHRSIVPCYYIIQYFIMRMPCALYRIPIPIRAVCALNPSASSQSRSQQQCHIFSTVVYLPTAVSVGIYNIKLYRRYEVKGSQKDFTYKNNNVYYAIVHIIQLLLPAATIHIIVYYVYERVCYYSMRVPGNRQPPRGDVGQRKKVFHITHILLYRAECKYTYIYQSNPIKISVDNKNQSIVKIIIIIIYCIRERGCINRMHYIIMMPGHCASCVLS